MTVDSAFRAAGYGGLTDSNYEAGSDTGVQEDLGSTQDADPDATFDGDISANGRVVAFTSAEGLLADDTNGSLDVYIFDRNTRQLTRASLDEAGLQSAGDSRAAQRARVNLQTPIRPGLPSMVPHAEPHLLPGPTTS